MVNKTQWSIPVPKALDDAVEKAVHMDTYATKAAFVRDAVRRRLEEMGFRPRIFEEDLENDGKHN
jgi:Arc/MetJ-type ribon-helix-helix transcriptional regulator